MMTFYTPKHGKVSQDEKKLSDRLLTNQHLFSSNLSNMILQVENVHALIELNINTNVTTHKNK